jgi:hypothetical protein
MRFRLLTGLVIAGAFATACAAPMPSSPPASEQTTAPVQSSPNPGLVELEGRMADAATELGSIVRALGEASGGSSQELGLAAGRLQALAEAESDWLGAHDAGPCYAVATTAYAIALASLAEAAVAFRALASAPSPSDAEGQAAGIALSEGSEGIEAARAAALEARAACR